MSSIKEYTDHSTGEHFSGVLYAPDEVEEMDEVEILVASSDSFYVRNHQVTSKLSAMEANTNRYWKGVPCKNNHISDRYLKGQCIQCFRENVKRKRKTEHGKDLYKAARKRAVDRKRDRVKETATA